MSDGKFDSIKEEVWKQFRDYQPVFLATSDADQPRVRPVTLICLEEKFWIVTGTNDSKVKQIQKNPRIEICLFLKEGDKRGYVRIAGLAKIIQDRQTKTRIAKLCKFFNDFWKSPDDPSYTLIRFSNNEVEYLRPDEIETYKFKL